LQDLLHQSPRQHAWDTGVWILELASEVALEQGLSAWRVSGETVRATMARMGVRCKIGAAPRVPPPKKAR
jgi:hypothetical protein